MARNYNPNWIIALSAAYLLTANHGVAFASGKDSSSQAEQVKPMPPMASMVMPSPHTAPAKHKKPMPGCSPLITWDADLISDSQSPAVKSVASGTVTFMFDLQNPTAVCRLSVGNPSNVRRIELRLVRPQDSPQGYLVALLYPEKDGKFPGTITRKLAESDFVQQDLKAPISFSDLQNAFAGHFVKVVVCTKVHPDGELSGMPVMHKTEQSMTDASGDKPPAMQM